MPKIKLAAKSLRARSLRKMDKLILYTSDNSLENDSASSSSSEDSSDQVMQPSKEHHFKQQLAPVQSENERKHEEIYLKSEEPSVIEPQ